MSEAMTATTARLWWLKKSDGTLTPIPILIRNIQRNNTEEKSVQ